MNITDPYILKEEGLKHIQEYAGQVWTDHNLHDPGIIILEQLCYALADLNYRASFEVADLLERPNSNDRNLLYSARNILHTQPCTATDFRKLLLDVKGVRNAWVVPGAFSQPIYYNQARTALSTQSWKQEDHERSDQLHPQGILDIVLSFDVDAEGNDLNNNKYIKHLDHSDMIVAELPRWDQEEINWDDTSSIWEHRISIKWITESGTRYYHELDESEQTQAQTHVNELIATHQLVVQKAHQVLKDVREKLHQHRNLGQDFGQISAIKSEDIGFTSEIEIEGDVDLEELLAELLFRLNGYFSPQVQFRTLDQLIEEGWGTEEIFDGPALEHGFLPDNELPKQLTSLRTSDLIDIMMDVPGIEAIKNFHAATYPEGVLFRSAQRWCVRLNPDINYSPRIAPERIHLDFFVDGMAVPFSWDRALMLYQSKLSVLASRKYPTQIQVDYETPYGTYKELDRHYSIQKEFSSNFGIGEEGLSVNASVQRKAEAHQLKSFLMIFEQLLANHASQLNAIPELLSADLQLDRTLFSQLPEDIPALETLLVQTNNEKDLIQAKDAIESSIQELIEEKPLFVRRRNRLLNHLMARFGEDISNHALLKSTGTDPSDTGEIANKAQLLNSYPELSANRASGFNYQQKEASLGSFHKHVYALIGIQDFEWKTLGDKSASKAEGFHIIEHILLRPHPEEGIPNSLIHSSFLPLYQYPEDPWSEDPYSSIISVVIPDWSSRFKDQQTRDYVERVLHLQAPAHVHLIIHWMSKKKMQEFESVFLPWITKLGENTSDPHGYAEALANLVNVIKPWYDQVVPKTPKPIVPESGELIPQEGLWESPQTDAKWYQLANSNIMQGVFVGEGTRGITGNGASLLINLQELQQVEIDRVEMIRMRFVPGAEEHSECGLIFDYESEREHKRLYYAHHSKAIVLAHVSEGETEVLMSSPVKDLSGREVRIEMHAQTGRLQLFQSSKGLIGTEFMLQGSGSVANNRVGFFSRYTQEVTFTYLEFIDDEHREVVFRTQTKEEDE